VLAEYLYNSDLRSFGLTDYMGETARAGADFRASFDNGPCILTEQRVVQQSASQLKSNLVAVKGDLALGAKMSQVDGNITKK
jgi:hypothetical protein